MTVTEQQQAQLLYRYSFKIEMTAKGLVMPSIHVYSNDIEIAGKEAVDHYAKLVDDLKAKGFIVAAPGMTGA
jgi:hypothetical protein